MGFTPTNGEPCLYYMIMKNKMILVLVYVDDLLLASQDVKWIEEIKRGLSEEFDLKDFGSVRYCLGLEIGQVENTITISQRGYILGMLKRFKMEECNAVRTPADFGVKLDASDEKDVEERWPYRELIGGLMYLAVATRPDIANAVAKLAQFNNSPGKQHWIAAKRVLRYLRGTIGLDLVYKKTNETLKGFTDADWAACIVDCRSFTGYAFILAGAAISWKSQKQRTGALSSTEAEYISLAEGVKEAVHLRGVLCELGLQRMTKIVMHVDNQGAKCLASDHVFHLRTKHIDARYHFIREIVSSGAIRLEYLPTDRMPADVLTKSLPSQKHLKCIESLGVHRI